ncbi:MAG: hypothetical protein ABEJ73_07505 [Haloplanus sp.]
MQRRSLVIGAAVVLLVAVPVMFGLGTGSGSGADGERSIESFPTETPTATGTDSGTGTATGGTTTPVPDPSFTFTIDRIEKCGETCRDVTSTLTNDGAAATDVTVYTRIYAGNGTDGDVVWKGREPVGALGAGESYTTTKRVELSMTDAFAVQQSGGWITVQTTIQSAEKTVTFTQRRQVA